MAIQILPRQEDSGIYSGLGQLLGQLGGLGIGYGINKLIGTEDQDVNQLIQAGLMSAEEAKIYKRMKTPQERSSFLNNVMKQSEGKRQAELISRAMGGTPVGLQGSQMGQAPTMGAPANIPQPGIDALGSLGGSNMGLLSQLEQQRQNVLNSGANPMLVKDAIASIDRQIDLTLKKESMQRKQALEEKKLSIAEQRDVNKETKPFYDSVKSKAKDAKENDMRLDRMEELVKSGKLVGPGFFKVMDKLGIPTDPASSEFQKLSNDFLKSAKSVFGSRVTEGEVKLFLQTVPNLGLSDEGKLRLINNLKIMNEGARAENEAMKQILKENGGRRPADLEDLVEERTKAIKDKLARDFKAGVRNVEIPEETWGQLAERILPGPALSIGAPVVGGLLGGPVGATLGALGGGAFSNILGMLGKKQ